MNAIPTPTLSRRLALQSLSGGFGYLAFSALSTMAAEGEKSPLAPKEPHFAPKAKRVIFLYMRGAPSHVDTFDHKPDLTAASGKTAPNRGTAKLLGSPWEFSQHGKSGQWISSLFPNVAKHADEMCIVNSMHTDIPNHPQATVQMHTGNFQFVRPSMGAWALYGLGTENQSLPGFVTLSPPAAVGGAQIYGSAFLPAIYQGTPIGREQQGRRFGANQNDSIANISNGGSLDQSLQRVQLDYIKSLNIEKLKRDVHQPEVEGVIESFELAYRMQDEVPKVLDISGESAETQKLYGIDRQATAQFGRQCLVARRMAEAGVRFIEVTHGNWDHHRNLRNALETNCVQIDLPIHGLLTDLKRRDLLKDTLVMWGGEFGRTPHSQGNDGRDHNSKGFSLWMAGGGAKGGLRHGSTDELGYQAVEGKVHVNDWHATILHLLGLDHERLTYRYAGRDFRLTNIAGRVVTELVG
ncbi:MAG: DUF1501 domain-containing protein [Verrucomicrobiae bacterium]|nr:DUF1501 domain-containing protein [Verrucomicrobiae bacterium]MCP5541671.1 DUF1501 domain-containing protein [Akkermansiaceae bacterium]MCP5549316.1 DUF1501 domain-containing protein [Akkermansiaceae bacterium]